MPLTLGPLLIDAGIDPTQALVIRHAFVREHEDGFRGLHPDSTDAKILEYTRGYCTRPPRAAKPCKAFCRIKSTICGM